MTDSVQIVYKNKNVIIVNKPVGMPSQSDPSGDIDAMSATSATIKALGEDGSLWLVHRLDRTVGGLIAFARNKKSASALSSIVADGSLVKKYFAVCHGIAAEGDYVDYLFKDTATSKAYVVKTLRKGAKEARLNVRSLANNDGMSLLSVTLDTGRFHQIRAQLSSRGNSLVGDKKYGSRDMKRTTPSLFAYRLSFELFGKKIDVSIMPNLGEYPWNSFERDAYSQK